MRKVFAFGHYEEKRLALVASYCEQGDVLDIGYAQQPNIFLEGARCTGIDLAPPGSTSHYNEEIVGDATCLEQHLSGRKFDYIVAGEFIEHLEAPYDFLRSLKPFMKRNSKLIVTTPNPVSWPCIFFEWARSRKFYYTRQHTYYFAPRWVERVLDLCGFKVEEVKGVGLLLPFVTLPCPAAFSYQVVYVACLADPQDDKV